MNKPSLVTLIFFIKKEPPHLLTTQILGKKIPLKKYKIKLPLKKQAREIKNGHNTQNFE